MSRVISRNPTMEVVCKECDRAMDHEDKVIGLLEGKACDIFRCSGCRKTAWIERQGQFIRTIWPSSLRGH